MGIGAKAFVAGAGIELLCAWMLFGSGWGPCGPGSPLGIVGLFAHLFPGIAIASAFELFGTPKLVTNVLIVFSQFIFWSLLVFVMLKTKVRVLMQ